MDTYLRRTALWYGGVGLLTAQVFRSLALPPKYFRLILLEIETMGVRSLGVALTAAIFTGMVLALQSAVNMARFGAENYVGPVVALSILRELGPVLTAILVGGKVASGITAELGSMKVTEQIDALRALGVNYIKRLIVPRLLAALLVFPVVTVLADGIGLDRHRGTTLAVMGGSGAGKTVLLRIIAGLVRPDSGEVSLFGTRIDRMREEAMLALRRRTGFVFQGAALFDSLSVFENVAF